MNKKVHFFACVAFLAGFLSGPSVHAMDDAQVARVGAGGHIFEVGPRFNLFVPIPVRVNDLGKAILGMAEQLCEVDRQTGELMAHARTGTDNLVFQLSQLQDELGFVKGPVWGHIVTPYVVVLKMYDNHRDPVLGKLLYDLKEAYNRRINSITKLQLSEQEKARLADIKRHLLAYTIPRPDGAVLRPYGELDVG